MDEKWQMLYEAAVSVLNPREISSHLWAGSVAAAVLSKAGNVYTGVCLDTASSLGMCAERNAISTMITYGEHEIERVVAVYKDGKVIPPCGACRGFMIQLGAGAKDIEVLLDNSGRAARLVDLLPEWPEYK